MLTRIMASLTSHRRSQSRTSLRQCIIQPKVRSTTQRLGSTWKPFWSGSLRTISMTKSR
ncbi:hypothetical protein SAMN04487779_10135 [Belnapia rosea]|uniref:Uncharacterized protein n=1 Tax=Belnapia rosea TaxID=938405 RepID=A0A1G6XVP7_9PROT|nr:hypothetical protein SAMN04487779_10135 [Belnapia rosea]